MQYFLFTQSFISTTTYFIREIKMPSPKETYISKDHEYPKSKEIAEIQTTKFHKSLI
ncbi:hypothetical protein D3C87_558450 [compost metagenome]